MNVNKKIFTAGLFKKEYNLEKLLKNKYNNIQNKIKVINVVGTNGKGSVSSYLQKQLMVYYDKVGLFISPAFFQHNERIKINNNYISDSDIKKILKKIKNDIKSYDLTFFEIWVLICVIYFDIHNVDIAIIEAGIGGVKDATNIFNNQLLVALTSISYDHTEILGKNIESIISNKIKILKNDAKLIISNSVKSYLNIITKYITKENILIANKYKKAINYYQQENVGLVIKIIQYLKLKIDYTIFKTVLLLGRFTILNKNPYFIIDGAHNPEGINAMIKSIHFLNITNKKEIVVLFASSNKKKHEENLKILKKEFNCNLYITNFKHNFSWDIKKIKFNNKIYNWKKFIKANNNKNIIVCGSLYFMPIIYQYYMKRKKK